MPASLPATVRATSHATSHAPDGTAVPDGGRLHALDAVRAGALLLGIVLHGVVPFMPSTAVNGGVIVDSSPSQALSDLYLWIHMFRMPLFFLMAGFFARLVVERRGAARFAGDRLQRIALPFVLGCLLINPLSSWIIGRVIALEGRSPAPAWMPEGTVLVYPMSHLWFLYVLMLLYAAALGLRWLFARLDRRGRLPPAADAAVRWLLSSPVGPIFLGLPLAAALYTYPYWWVSLGIPAPSYSLVPNVPAGVGFSTSFGIGWLLHRQASLLHRLAREWPVNALGAVLFTAGCVVLGGTEFAAVVAGEGARMAYAVCYCAAAWYWVLCAVGAAMRFLPAPNAAVRYLADASYWMYLMHVPLLFALQATMMHFALHWSVKVSLLLGITTAVLLASYRWFVRGTAIGWLLSGRRA